MGGKKSFPEQVGIQNPVVLANTEPCRMTPADSAQIQPPVLNF